MRNVEQYFNDLKPSSFFFWGEPRSLTLDDYVDVQKEVAVWAKGNEVISGVYLIGTISAPGISDLDFLIFVDDRKGRKNKAKPNSMMRSCRKSFMYRLANSIRKRWRQHRWSYILSHNPIIAPLDMMQDFSKIFPIFSSFSIHRTESLPSSIIPTKEEDLLWNFIDLSVGRVSRIFMSALARRRVHLRSTLCYLHSMKYTIQMSEKISGEEVAPGAKFIEAITSLRKDWPFLPIDERKGNVIDLLKEAIYISFEANENVNLYLKDKYSSECDAKILFKHPRLGAYFCRNWDREKALEKQFSLYQNGGSTAILPSMFSIPIVFYASRKGRFGMYIRKWLNLKGGFERLQLSFDSLRNRFGLVERYLMMPDRMVYGSMPLPSLYGYQLHHNPLNATLDIDTAIAFCEYLLRNPSSVGSLTCLLRKPS